MADLENYLQDLGTLLKKNAFDVKEEVSKAPSGQRSFLDGKLLAYNEVLSLMINQAVAFGIEMDLTGLKGFDPDQEL